MVIADHLADIEYKMWMYSSMGLEGERGWSIQLQNLAFSEAILKLLDKSSNTTSLPNGLGLFLRFGSDLKKP